MFKSNTAQLLLVKFPILFPLAYGLVLYSFPSFEQMLLLITLFLLAESHFGATWPFFLNKTNYPYLKDKKIELIFIPLIITIACLIGFIFFNKIFLLIFFAANIYHVTRQSFGVCKLYCKNNTELNFQTNFIYIFNFLFFLVAFFRFYSPVIESESLFILNIIVLFLILLVSTYYIIRYGFSQNYLTFLTGCIIFYPACFVVNPVHIIIMGVTMHYTQYLYLTNYVYKSRVEALNQGDKFRSKSIFYFILIKLFYSLIMTFLSSFAKSSGNNFFQELIFIPILGQMLHFYLDSQIWKFSEKHNREHTLKYLNRIIN